MALSAAATHRILLPVEAALTGLAAFGLNRLWGAPGLALGLALPLLWRAVFILCSLTFTRLAGGATPWRELGLRRFLLMAADEYGHYVSNQWRMAFPPASSQAVKGDKRQPLVLLLHGWSCNAGYFGPLPRRLAAKGIETRARSLADAAGPIQPMADELGRWVMETAAAEPDRPLVLLAVSMGGLVARRMLADRPELPVATLITVGTPHAGTLWAYAAQGPAALEMRPGSPFLKALDAAGPTRIPVVAIWSADDNMVVPGKAARLAGAREIALPGVAHLSQCFAPETEQAVQEAVASVEGTEGRYLPRSRSATTGAK
ncbi:MAG: esterase/lipase family protein [Beijerinckiaceae bacterium]